MKLSFPVGKRFAFTIIDDTDVATLANVKPVYDLLYDCGLRTTKTVWPFRWDGQGSSFVNSDTLEDEPYLAFIQDLARQGFEIASHGATMESSERPITEAALHRFIECFGSVPTVYANHSYNAEGVYWGEDRFDDPLLRLLFKAVAGDYVSNGPGGLGAAGCRIVADQRTGHLQLAADAGSNETALTVISLVLLCVIGVLLYRRPGI